MEDRREADMVSVGKGAVLYFKGLARSQRATTPAGVFSRMV